jgi:hypothetical protein
MAVVIAQAPARSFATSIHAGQGAFRSSRQRGIQLRPGVLFASGLRGNRSARKR